LNKENSAGFKALPLDKKIFEDVPVVTPRKERVTETNPFNFRTDERLKSGKSVEQTSPSAPVQGFKARPVPKYKFFEVKHKDQSTDKLVFKEFNLATANIKRVRSNSHEEKDDNK
jgi:hypothetical protein